MSFRLSALAPLLLTTLAACGGEPPSPSSGGGRSMVVITLDTTRADFLGAYGGTLGVTPYLDGLAERGAVFEQAYAPMPQTLPSHSTLFTGLMPRHHGALENTYVLDERMVTLAESASERGYATGGFIGALAIEALTGISQGFTTWTQPEGDWGEDRLGHPPQRRAAAVTDDALAWADGLGAEQPFLLWAHYYDPHGDSAAGFNPPRKAWKAIDPVAVAQLLESRQERFTGPGDIGQLVPFWRGYAAELLYTDQQVERLLEGLGERGLMDDTLILVVGDHGEGLWEHGVKAHGTHLWEEAMRIPMILADPRGTGAGRRVAGRVQLQDVDATLRHAAFGELLPQQEEVRGLDLWPLLRDGGEPPPRPIVLERPHFGPERIQHRKGELGFLTAVLLDQLKLVLEPDGSTALFDLDQDPGELRDLSAERPEEAARGRAYLDQWIERNKSAPPGSAEISDERRQTLEALGYL